MVTEGQKVTVSYVGTLDDGAVFDSTEKHGGKPITFVVGAGQMIEGFDRGVLGMEIGETKDIEIPPEQAYGEYKMSLLQTEPIDEVPNGQELAEHVGQTLYYQDSGSMMPVRIVSAEDGMITVDFNHPLAGKTLYFAITVQDAQDLPKFDPSEVPPAGQPYHPKKKED